MFRDYDRNRFDPLGEERIRRDTWKEIREEVLGGKLTRFLVDGVIQPVRFIETNQVSEGVECDVYRFEEDETKDLGIIRIENGGRTPRQRVAQGERTVEGHLHGDGFLDIVYSEGTEVLFHPTRTNEESLSVTVGVGDTMQWFAHDGSSLIAYEVCYPPYQDGRFVNLG